MTLKEYKQATQEMILQYGAEFVMDIIRITSTGYSQCKNCGKIKKVKEFGFTPSGRIKKNCRKCNKKIKEKRNEEYQLLRLNKGASYQKESGLKPGERATERTTPAERARTFTDQSKKLFESIVEKDLEKKVKTT